MNIDSLLSIGVQLLGVFAIMSQARVSLERRLTKVETEMANLNKTVAKIPCLKPHGCQEEETKC